MFDLAIQLQLGSFQRDVAIATEATVLALTGYSGSGKTSVLNAVAGLIEPKSGHIRIGGRVLYDNALRINVPVEQRRLGFVFQDARLFPHLTVAQNLLYGRHGRALQAADRFQFEPVLALLGLQPLLHRRPANLSGGEAQRVAIGRALLVQPELLLLDEPLSALDRARREQVLGFLITIRDSLRLPMLYVSHSADEVRRLTDAVCDFDR